MTRRDARGGVCVNSRMFLAFLRAAGGVAFPRTLTSPHLILLLAFVSVLPARAQDEPGPCDKPVD